MKEWRESRGHSLDEMAQLTGLSKPSLSRIERNLTPYHQDILEIYASVCECTPADILGRAPTEVMTLWDYWDRIRESRDQALTMLRALAESDAERANNNANTGNGC